MNKNYKFTLTARKERKPREQIRSPAFMKKFGQGMPRINHKAIPFHNMYDIQVPNAKLPEEVGHQFWGCLTPEKKYSSRSSSKETDRKSLRTRGETLLTRYLKRRPSLTLTPQTDKGRKRVIENTDKKYETISDFKTLKHRKEQTTMVKNPQSDQKITDQSFMTTISQVCTINHKSVYQMTPKQLETSILWKKKFLMMFQNRVQKASEKGFHSVEY